MLRSSDPCVPFLFTAGSAGKWLSMGVLTTKTLLVPISLLGMKSAKLELKYKTVISHLQNMILCCVGLRVFTPFLPKFTRFTAAIGDILYCYKCKSNSHNYIVDACRIYNPLHFCTQLNPVRNQQQIASKQRKHVPGGNCIISIKFTSNNNSRGPTDGKHISIKLDNDSVLITYRPLFKPTMVRIQEYNATFKFKLFDCLCGRCPAFYTRLVAQSIPSKPNRVIPKINVLDCNMYWDTGIVPSTIPCVNHARQCYGLIHCDVLETGERMAFTRDLRVSNKCHVE